MKIYFVVLIFFITKITKCEEFSNTSNSCYYAIDKAIKGDLITQISISGNSLDDQLATCCTMCRALPGNLNLK